MKTLKFEDLKDYYTSYEQHRGCYEGSIGEIYNLRNNVVNPISCKHWSCPKCRPKKKYQLYQEIFYLSKNLGMDKHFIMTFGGKEFREKYSFVESYKIMAKIWNKYKKVIEYHKGKFDYIILPRAQKDGVCHYHCIMQKGISWYFLDKKRKLYPEMGFVSINKNVDLADYLHTDFFKDSEYWIPDGVRHYSSSRGIKFNHFSDPYFQEDNAIAISEGCSYNPNQIVYDPEYYAYISANVMKDEKREWNEKTGEIKDCSFLGDVTAELEARVLHKFGRLLPSNYYISKYYKKRG